MKVNGPVYQSPPTFDLIGLSSAELLTISWALGRITETEAVAEGHVPGTVFQLYSDIEDALES